MLTIANNDEYDILSIIDIHQISRNKHTTWAIVVGIGVLSVWFKVGGPRLSSNRSPLWVICARSVANPVVTRGVRQSLWGSQGDQTCCSYEIKCVM